MDKLTLITLATHTPNAVIVDNDGDRWHVQCLLAWVDEAPNYQKELSYLSQAGVLDNEVISQLECYYSGCNHAP